MIITENITKYYKKNQQNIKAIDHITFSVRTGENFGIIGPTGAGKTTIIKILSTLIIPDEGRGYVDNFDIITQCKEVQKRIGVVAGEFSRSLYWRLSGRKNLDFFSKMKGINNKDRIEYLLNIFNLTNYADEPVMKYSTGMKHKLCLAIALLNDPPILFLDEPLIGIDPITTYNIKLLMKKEFKEKTILWTSHNLNEIEEMCQKVLLLNKGSIVLKGRINDLRRKYWDYEKIRIKCDRPNILLSLNQSYLLQNGTVEIKTKNISCLLKELLDIIKKQKITVFDITTIEPSLEDIFMKVIEND